MTLSPLNLRAVASYWVSRGGVNLGIVGDTSHQQKGTSYHLGESDLKGGAYSAFTARDKAGLSEYASAIDLGKVKNSLTTLRDFSDWLVKECRRNAPDTKDIREVIWFSRASSAVMRWDRERGVASEPRKGEADNSHVTHTHVSYYRDSRQRPQVPPFKRYFEPSTSTPHFGASVTTATPLWNETRKVWVYNGPNAIKVGTKMVIRGAQYTKGGKRCWPVVRPYSGYYVPVANVKLGPRA